MLFYPIDEALAKKAFEALHDRAYVPGCCTMDYQSAVEDAVVLVARRKTEVDPRYYSELHMLLDQYAKHLAKWYNLYNLLCLSYSNELADRRESFRYTEYRRRAPHGDAVRMELAHTQRLLRRIRRVGAGRPPAGIGF
jgi:hypothetical protein